MSVDLYRDKKGKVVGATLNLPTQKYVILLDNGATYKEGRRDFEKKYTRMSKSKKLHKKGKKREFKEFDRVLVRNSSKKPWKLRVFSHMGKLFWCTDGKSYEYCKFYRGNEYLLGAI